MPTLDELFVKVAVEREIEEGVVKLSDSERGICMEFELVQDLDLGRDVVELTVTTTPEFRGERKTYQEECKLTYAMSGKLMRMSTNIFMGDDINEGLVRSAEGLTPFTMAALSYAGQQGNLVSEIAGPEAGATLMTQLGENYVKYLGEIEEPTIVWRRVRVKETGQEVWVLELEPTRYVDREFAIRGKHRIGRVEPGSGQVLQISWEVAGNKRVFNYTVAYGPTGELPVISFTTFVDIPVMTEDGFAIQRLAREVRVPDKLDIGLVEDLFDPNSSAYQDAFDKIPVDIIKPV